MHNFMLYFIHIDQKIYLYINNLSISKINFMIIIITYVIIFIYQWKDHNG